MRKLEECVVCNGLTEDRTIGEYCGEREAIPCCDSCIPVGDILYFKGFPRFISEPYFGEGGEVI
jgi:hypothetical protein